MPAGAIRAGAYMHYWGLIKIKMTMNNVRWLRMDLDIIPDSSLQPETDLSSSAA